MKANKTMRGWEASNHRRRKDKESKSSIDLAEQLKSLNNKTAKSQQSPLIYQY
jgi:hypothetical protein